MLGFEPALRLLRSPVLCGLHDVLPLRLQTCVHTNVTTSTSTTTTKIIYVENPVVDVRKQPNNPTNKVSVFKMLKLYTIVTEEYKEGILSRQHGVKSA